jgi:hypothetical protein
MAGTFIIRPTILGQNDNWFGIGGTVLQGFQNSAGGNPKCQNGPGTNALARLTFFGDCIYLDGSLVPIAFTDLPSGFTPITATVKAQASNGGAPAGQLFFQAGPVGEEAALNQFYVYEVEQPPPMASILTIYSNGMGIRSVALAGTAFSLAQNARVEGTYDLLAFQWTLDTVTPVNPGDTISLSSPSGTPIPPALNFTELSEVSVNYIDRDGNLQFIIITLVFPNGTTQYGITWSENAYSFILPPLPGLDASQPVAIMGVGDGTQFSGSVMLGVLDILIENGSGIYRIIADKTNDTLYVNSAVDDTTADVRIPDPFAKTGFIGG